MARSGQVLYATSTSGTGTIYAVDIDQNTLTPVITNTGQSDSLIFTPGGQIIYTNSRARRVPRRVRPRHENEQGPGQRLQPDRERHLARAEPYERAGLRPGHGRSLPCLPLRGKSLLGSYGAGYLGLNGTAYDASGHLFASIANSVAELDPVTGAVMKTVAVTYADGLTHDPYSGKLFVASITTASIYEIDPKTLTATLAAGGISGPDGITADGMGNVFAASLYTGYIYQYNEITHTVTRRTFVPALDDLAPASGLGAPCPSLGRSYRPPSVPWPWPATSGGARAGRPPDAGLAVCGPGCPKRWPPASPSRKSRRVGQPSLRGIIFTSAMRLHLPNRGWTGHSDVPGGEAARGISLVPNLWYGWAAARSKKGDKQERGT